MLVMESPEHELIIKSNATEKLALESAEHPIDEVKEEPNPTLLTVESNNDERLRRKDSVKTVTFDEEKNESAAPSPRTERIYSQTYDGVFSNLTARPEIMVLPKDDVPENDPPPVQPTSRSLLISLF